MAKASVELADMEDPGSVKSMTLLVDKDIDGAARAISAVALPGECLLLHSAAALVGNVSNLMKLPEQRVKGKGKAFEVFLVIPTSRSVAS